MNEAKRQRKRGHTKALPESTTAITLNGCKCMGGPRTLAVQDLQKKCPLPHTQIECIQNARPTQSCRTGISASTCPPHKKTEKMLAQKKKP